MCALWDHFAGALKGAPTQFQRRVPMIRLYCVTEKTFPMLLKVRDGIREEWENERANPAA